LPPPMPTSLGRSSLKLFVECTFHLVWQKWSLENFWHWIKAWRPWHNIYMHSTI
jgi:hypothetical protein